VLVMAGMVIGMCFTWPTLEALVSEGETPERLPAMIGSYNVVWAGTGALAYFSGGAMLDKFGLRNMFYVPAAIFLIQLGFTFWLEAQARLSARRSSEQTSSLSMDVPTQKDCQRFSLSPSLPRRSSTKAGEGERAGVRGPFSLRLIRELNPRPAARAKTFLRMAWLANPFAYIAINTLIAVIPGVATRLGLSTTLAGFYCSIWCFARVAAFFALWWWEGWHYRFSWLLAAYLTILGTFTVLLLAPNLLVLIAAQVVFGLALGLIYYSSLFYSMDVGETKGEHGGIHEAAIGLGNFAGPAVGAASLHFLPQYANSGAIAVSGLLLLGLGGLVAIWRFSSSSSS
jgi:MFS family permease